MFANEINNPDKNINSPESWALLIKKEFNVDAAEENWHRDYYQQLVKARYTANMLQKMVDLADETGIPDDVNYESARVWCRTEPTKQVQIYIDPIYEAILKQLATFVMGNGITALIFGCKTQYADVAKELIKAGADVNAGGMIVPSPLMVAAESGSIEIMDMLLKHGARINNKRSYKKVGWGTPLVHVICGIPLDLDINSPDKNEWDRIYKVIDFLLKNGADPDATDRDNRTPLMHTLFKQRTVRLPILELLMSYKPKVDQLDRFGRSALSYAAEGGDYESVKFLMKHGAKPTYAVLEGLAVLDDIWIVELEQYIRILEELLTADANVNELVYGDQIGTTLLMKCLRGQKAVFVEAFLKRGAQVDAVDVNGMTALMHFMGHSYSNTPDYIALFVDGYKANINEQDYFGRTALMHAFMEDQPERAFQLIERHANLDLKDVHGNTAMMYALNPFLKLGTQFFPRSRHTRTIESVTGLLENGAYTLLKDKTGHTALMHVCHIHAYRVGEHKKLFQLLLYTMLRQASLSDLNWIKAECVAVNQYFNAFNESTLLEAELGSPFNLVERLLSPESMVEYIIARVTETQSIARKIKLLEEATLTAEGRPVNALSAFLNKKPFSQWVSVRENPVEPLKRMLAELKAGMGNGAGPSSVRINTNNI